MLCEYKRAATILEQARDLASRMNDRVRLAQILDHLAWVAAQVGPLNEAQAMARESLALNEELETKRGVAVALNNLGWIAFYRGDREQAEAHFFASLRLRREVFDYRSVAFALANLAMARLTENEGLDEVDSWLQEARELIDHLGDPPLQGWVSCMKSRLLVAKGKPVEALTRLEFNLKGARESNHPDGLAWILLSQGEAHQAGGDNLSARECFEEALAIWRSLESPWGTARALICLAKARKSAGAIDIAMSFSREALEISERFGLDGFARQCRAELAG